MLDSGAAQCCNDDSRSGVSLLFVPFMPGAMALQASIASASAEERGIAVDKLVGVGEVLHELMGFEEEASRSFQALPREYQEWIISLISQVLARLCRNSRSRR